MDDTQQRDQLLSKARGYASEDIRTEVDNIAGTHQVGYPTEKRLARSVSEQHAALTQALLIADLLRSPPPKGPTNTRKVIGIAATGRRGVAGVLTRRSTSSFDISARGLIRADVPRRATRSATRRLRERPVSTRRRVGSDRFAALHNSLRAEYWQSVKEGGHIRGARQQLGHVRIAKSKSAPGTATSIRVVD